MQSEEDLASWSEFVDPCGLFENRDIRDIETILNMQTKESIYLSSNGQATNQV